MKLFIMSDIHGSQYYLTKAIEAYEREKADYIILLGDALYHGPRNQLPKDYNPKNVSESLNMYKDKIMAVRGNCDSEVDQMLIQYPMMSDYSIVLYNNKKIFLTHGHIFNKDNKPNLAKGDIFIQGHTHLPVAENCEGIYYLNPGSVSLPKNGNPNSYGIIENDKFSVKDLEGNVIKEIDFK